MRSRRATRFVIPTACWLAILATTAQADSVNTTLFNATTNSGGDEPAGLGTGFSASSAVGGTDDPQGAFGNNDGPIEPSTFIFGDGGVADNGNGTLGDGGETVDTLSWSTTSPVLITGYRADISGDGGGPSRGTELFRFNSAGESDDFWDANFASGAISRTFAIPQIASSFSTNSTRSSSAGPRFNEIDAIVPDALPGSLRVAPIHFNATTNVVGEGDQAPGLAGGFSSSSVLGGETLEDAFGNNNGGVEGNTVIFSDAGAVADNLNNAFDVGVETIDFIQWSTTSPLTVYGYQIGVGADDAGGYRGIELLRFYVDGVVRDTIDANHVVTMDVQRVFGGGAVTGSTFRVEVTRFNAGGGPRVFEIDPILAQNVGPTAEANGPYNFSAGALAQTLSSAGSFDPEGIPLVTYDWSTTGTIATGASPVVSLTTAGLTTTTSTVNLTLTVTDFEGASGSDSTSFGYSNAGPTVASASATTNPNYSVTFNGSFADVDLAVNGLVSSFEDLIFEFDLTQATLPGQVGDGFLVGATAPTQTTNGLLSGTLSLSQLISLFGGLGTFTAWANVRDSAGLVASLPFTVNVVPEPSSLLVWVGLVLSVVVWRRRSLLPWRQLS